MKFVYGVNWKVTDISVVVVILLTTVPPTARNNSLNIHKGPRRLRWEYILIFDLHLLMVIARQDVFWGFIGKVLFALTSRKYFI